MFERLLIPLDGSELAETALLYGEELGKRLESEVEIFHVCESQHRQFEHMHKIYLDIQAETLARKIRAGQPDSAKVSVTAQVEEGNPAENICSRIEQKDIGLVIKTSAGASGHKIGALGSVVDHVSRTVTIPIMVVKPGICYADQGREATD